MAAYFSALLTVLQPTHLIIILVCSLAGIVFGAIPGLSGGLGVSLLLPLTFGMEPTLGFAMLIGMWVGGVSGSFIAATLVSIPGSPASIATCFDAYPMSQKGETVRALSIGIMGSFTGTFFSTIIATILSPLIADLALKLGPWEYFSLCFCAITLVASLSKGSIFKGLMGAFLGLFIATIGMDPVTAQTRFTFGSVWLSAGISMVPLMLGIFAIKQVAIDYAKGQQDMPDVDTKIKGIGIRISDITSNIGNIIRSFMIGLWVGFLPGMGSGLSNMVAYAQARSSSKHPEEFGKGCPDGIWASEVSNNASVGGALIPMMALGIPGDSTTALLLSGLMIHGLQPGPLMIQANPSVSYVIFAATLVAAVIVLIMQLFGMRWFPYLLKIPYHYLYGVILVMCFVGGYTSGNTMFNVVMMLVFAGVSILMDMAKIPSSPFILAFILGPNLEEYFRKGMSYGTNGILDFVYRPVSLIFLLIAVFSVAWPYIKNALDKKKQAA
jgi:putative tricarboxylic transport membrane protein